MLIWEIDPWTSYIQSMQMQNVSYCAVRVIIETSQEKHTPRVRGVGLKIGRCAR